MTLDWIKNQVALKLEVAYKDVTLLYQDRPVIDPFCIVDMGLQTGAILVVRVRKILILID